MKWILLCVFSFSSAGFSAMAQPAAESNMEAGKKPAAAGSCQTPEGLSFEKGKPGYKNCMRRKKINRDQKKQPNFQDANDGMGMGIREGN